MLTASLSKQQRADIERIRLGVGAYCARKREPGADGLMISISNLRDYFDVRALDTDVEQGTQVTLHLKRSKTNYCRSLEVTGYLKTTIRILDIPVDLHGQNGQITTIGRENLSYEKTSSADIDFFAPLAFKNSEGIPEADGYGQQWQQRILASFRKR